MPELIEPDHGAVHLEVVELLGVDRPDDARVPHLDQVVDHRRGRVGGVVPALEGRDHHRLDQVVDVLDLDHSTTVVTWGTSRLVRRAATNWRAPPAGVTMRKRGPPGGR